MRVKSLIEGLNSLNVGEVSTLSSRVKQYRDEAQDSGLNEVTEILDEALASLQAMDVKTFRKKIQHSVSRLGHVRAAS